MSKSEPPKATLASKVATDLRMRIKTGEFPPGERLPSEAELADTYDVSRPTIRTALRELEWANKVTTKHGVGTFVTIKPAISAGLERLESISESIRATGQKPGMEYVMKVVRMVMPEEADAMEVGTDTEVLEIRRCILADEEVVAYSYDLILTEIFPKGFDFDSISGSIFTFLGTHLGIEPKEARAEVRAVNSSHVGWGHETSTHEDLFVLLKQVHYDQYDRMFMYSRTYFIDGRYTFNLIRR